MAGLVVWGLHRDTPELAEIGLPVFSYGGCPAGPVRLAEREPEALVTARFGEHLVSSGDLVFADDDGVLFVGGRRGPSRCWPPPARSAKPSGTRPAGSGQARRCASRRPSMTTWTACG